MIKRREKETKTVKFFENLYSKREQTFFHINFNFLFFSFKLLFKLLIKNINSEIIDRKNRIQNIY